MGPEVSKSLTKGEIASKLEEHGIEGDVLSHVSIDADGVGDSDVACLVRTPEGNQSTIFILDNGQSRQIRQYQETAPDRTAAPWDSKRYLKVRDRLSRAFSYAVFNGRSGSRSPGSHNSISEARQASTWERVESAVKDFLTARPSNSKIYEDQIDLVEEMQKIGDPRFIGVLTRIADGDAKLGRQNAHDLHVIAATDRAISSLIPHLTMEELIRLKAHTEKRLADVSAYWEKNKAAVGEDLANRHIARLRQMNADIEKQVRERIRSDRPAVASFDTKYKSTHYKEALNGLAATPVKAGKGLAELVRESNVFNLIPRLNIVAYSAVLTAVTDIPAEIAGLATAGAYGKNGADLGLSLGNTILSLLPFTRMGKVLRARASAPAEVAVKGTKPPAIEVTEGVIFEDRTQSKTPSTPKLPSVEQTPLGPVEMPGRAVIGQSKSPGPMSADGLATYTEVEAPVCIERTASTVEISAASEGYPVFSPPPKVHSPSLGAAVPDVPVPISMPGAPGTIMTEPKSYDSDDGLIVLPGADKALQPIGDPTGNEEGIGDAPSRTDDSMWASAYGAPDVDVTLVRDPAVYSEDIQIENALREAGIDTAQYPANSFTKNQLRSLAIIAEYSGEYARRLLEEAFDTGAIQRSELDTILENVPWAIIHGFPIDQWFKKDIYVQGERQVIDVGLISGKRAEITGAVAEINGLEKELDANAMAGYHGDSSTRPMDGEAPKYMQEVLDMEIVHQRKKKKYIDALYDETISSGYGVSRREFDVRIKGYTDRVQFDRTFETRKGEGAYTVEIKQSNGNDAFGVQPVWDKFIERQLQVMKQLAYAKAKGYGAVKVVIYSKITPNQNWLAFVTSAANKLGILLRIQRYDNIHSKNVAWSNGVPIASAVKPHASEYPNPQGIHSRTENISKKNAKILESIVQETEPRWKAQRAATPKNAARTLSQKTKLYERVTDLVRAMEECEKRNLVDHYVDLSDFLDVKTDVNGLAPKGSLMRMIQDAAAGSQFEKILASLENRVQQYERVFRAAKAGWAKP